MPKSLESYRKARRSRFRYPKTRSADAVVEGQDSGTAVSICYHGRLHAAPSPYGSPKQLPNSESMIRKATIHVEGVFEKQPVCKRAKEARGGVNCEARSSLLGSREKG